MEKKLIFFVIFCVCIVLLHSSKVVVSIPFTTSEDIENLIISGYDIASVVPGKEVHIVIDETDFNDFSVRYQVLSIVFDEKNMRENLISSTRTPDNRVLGYRTYEEILEQMQAYSEDYPDFCQMVYLGPSQGKIYFDNGNQNYQEYDNEIFGVKLSNNVNEFQDKPNYYFIGLLHAREPLSSEVCMTILDDLLNSYTGPEDLEHPINQSQIWIVPVVNPDGYHVVLSQQDVWHRKTIYDNNYNGVLDLGNGYSPDGIDLNRNFSYKWGTTGISTAINHPTYPGTSPFSGVEAGYIKDLMEEIQFVAGISYHTYGNYVLYPLGYAYGITSHNQQTISDLAIELAGLTNIYNSTQTYQPMPGWDLYPASGTSEDYSYYQHNTLAFTFELANVFIPNYTEALQICQNNLPAAHRLLSRHKTKFLTGKITCSETENPVIAEILVYPVDSNHPERAKIFSDSLFGRYNYPLMPGEYEIEVKASNYKNFRTFFNIFEDEPTIIDIQLEPENTITLTLKLNKESYADNFFSNCQVIVKSVTDDTLYTNENAELILTNFRQGKIDLIVSSSDLRKYITQLYFDDNDNNSYRNVLFYDYDFWDDFSQSFVNWNSANWIINPIVSYYGNNSANAMSSFPYSVITSSAPLIIDSSNKTYISYMAKYSETINPWNYTEFYLSRDNITWDLYNQIYSTENSLENGWQHFYHILPENSYDQLYFKFHYRVFTNDPAFAGYFYLDMFSVSNNPVFVSVDEKVFSGTADFSFSTYPNPFNPVSNIEFSLTNDENIRISIYNVKGQLVRDIVNSKLSKGKHTIAWDGKNLYGKDMSSGIYFVRISSEKFNSYKKIVMIK